MNNTPTATVVESTNPTLPKKGNAVGKIFLFIITGLFLLLVIGLLIAHTGSTNIPVLSDIVEQIEKVVITDESIAKTITTNAANEIERILKGDFTLATNFPTKYRYALELSGEYTDSDSKLSTASLMGTGQVDTSSEDLKTSLDITTDVNTHLTDLSIEPSISLKVLGDINNPIVYFNLDNLPEELSSFIATDINNKWIKLDVNSLLQQFGLSDIGQILTTETEVSNISQENINKIKEFIQSDAVIKGFKRMPDKVIDNARAYCYEFNFDKTKLENLLTEAKEIYPAADDDNGLLSIFNTVVLSSCVGRKDNLPYEVGLEFLSSGFDDFSDSETIKLNLKLSFSEFNKPVSIEAPETDMLFEELLQEFFGNLQQQYAEEDSF